MRAFIAIPIDQNTTRILNDHVKTLKNTDWGKEIIWFPETNYHLTLQFLGSKLDPQKISDIAASMQNWFAEGMSFFDAEIRGIQLFPNNRLPHTIIASLQNTLLLQSLVREIEEQLKPFGVNRSKQAFRPHISLGRIPKTVQPESILIPADLQNLYDITLTVDQLILYQSELTSRFPCYTALQTKLLERYDEYHQDNRLTTRDSIK